MDTEITFTKAYDELKAITDTLNGEQVDADRLVELLRKGKGLESALRTHLTEIEQEVEAIENGEGAATYKIVTVAPAGDS
jgi:exodeoxyribonuclease VII small subunit